MSILNTIITSVVFVAVIALLGIIASYCLVGSFQRSLVTDIPLPVPVPDPPKATSTPPIEFRDAPLQEVVYVGSDELKQLRRLDPFLFQYLVRRVFLKHGTPLPSDQNEQHEKILKAVCQNELVALQCSLGDVVRYACSFIGEELLLLSIDASESMERNMENGIPRFLWSKGIALSLISQAHRRKAGVLLRMFTSIPHDVQFATSQGSFDEVIDALLAAKSGGRTDVSKALEQSLDDRMAKRRGYKRFHIIQLTDTIDGECGDLSALCERFGSDTFLHVALLGGDVHALQAIAHTHRVYQ